MQGVLRGLRAGVEDSERAREAEQQRLFREQQMLHARNQEARLQQDFDTRVAKEKATASALQEMQDLDTQDARVQGGDISGATGIPMPRPVDERMRNNAARKYALSTGNMRDAEVFRGKNQDLDINDEVERISKDPAMQERIMGYITTKDKFPLKIREGKRNAKGLMESPDILEFDNGYKHDLKEGDRQRIARGMALMKFGRSEEGLKAIGEVNKELAAAIDEANKRTVSMYNARSQADDRLADNEVRREQILTQRAARAAAGSGRAREISPETRAKLRDLEQAFVNAKTPTEKMDIHRQYQMVMSQAGFEIGKPLGLPSMKPERQDFPMKDKLAEARQLMERTPGLSLQGAMQQIDAATGAEGAKDPMEVLKETLARMAAEKQAKKAAPSGAIPSQPMSYDRMPLEALRGYTSPEARAIYQRRLEEQQNLARQPRFWISNQGDNADVPMGMDRGY